MNPNLARLQAYPFERLTDDTWFERADVRSNVREFRHGLRILPSNV